MKIKHIISICGILILSAIPCVLFVVGLRMWHETTAEDQKISREKVQNVVSDLRLGMTKLQVYAVFEKHHWTNFSEEEGEIRMYTKPQPLPTSWIIRLFFSRDELSAIKYVSVDDISHHPEDAPPDVTESQEKTETRTY